jgi:hypothetical protein
MLVIDTYETLIENVRARVRQGAHLEDATANEVHEATSEDREESTELLKMLYDDASEEAKENPAYMYADMSAPAEMQAVAIAELRRRMSNELSEQADSDLGRYRIDFHLGANGLLVKVTSSFEAPSDALLSEVAAGIEGQRFAVGSDEYDDELQPMFSDHRIGPFTIKLDRDEDGHLTMFVRAEDKDLGPVDRQISEDSWAGRYVLPSNDSRYHE